MVIFLNILKIIGIVLLSILGFLLCLLLIVLFVPVRYGAAFDYNEKLHFEGKVTYLLHIISFKVIYEDEAIVKLKIFGIPLNLNKEKKPKKIRNKDKAGNTEVENNDDSHDNNIDVSETTALAEDNSTKDKVSVTEVNDKNNKSNSDECDEVKNTSDSSDKKSEKESQTKSESKSKFDFEKVSDYIDVLSDESTKRAFFACTKFLGRLIRHVLPRKVRIKVAYGLDNPAITGYIMAINNVLMTYTGKSLILYPSYDEKKLNILGYLKGRIVFGPVLVYLLIVVLNRDCRRFYKLVRAGSKK